MFDKLISFIPDKKSRDVAMAGGGMLALLTGNKVVGLSMFAKGAQGLEEEWRRRNPDFEGTLSDRWERAISFYESTHEHPVNRKLHVIGIPMILGGAAGLLMFRPYRPLWFIAASSFTAGWLLNFIGHGVYEKKAPAFADDPLSFLAGPVWDFKYGGKSRPKDPSMGVGVTDHAHEDVNVAGTAAA
jgi:hypothetical protein